MLDKMGVVLIVKMLPTMVMMVIDDDGCGDSGGDSGSDMMVIR